MHDDVYLNRAQVWRVIENKTSQISIENIRGNIYDECKFNVKSQKTDG